MHTTCPNTTTAARERVLLVMCAALVLLLGLTRQFVLCTHENGDTHLEFAHVEGSPHGHFGGHFGGHLSDGHPAGEEAHLPGRTHHCGCGHHHHGSEPGGGDDGEHPHDSCTHVQLDVDFGPQPEAGSLPTWATAIDLESPPLFTVCWLTCAQIDRAPPATGPPIHLLRVPRSFLEHRRATVLLI